MTRLPFPRSPGAPCSRRRLRGSATWPSPGSPPGRPSGPPGPLAPEVAALPGPGQAGDLPLHGRWAVARRQLRLQAEAHRPTPASRSARAGPPRPSCSLRPGSSSSTARAASGSPTSSPRSPSTPTTSASSTACRPTSRTIPRRSSSCTRGSSSSPGPRSGAWVLYGLGTENENLPGFVTLCPPANNGGPSNYGSAFLPAIYQGTRIGFSELPITDAKVEQHRQSRSSPCPTSAQQLDLVQSLNRRRWSATRSTRPSRG